MNVTVAICTYNRCQLLAETLESLAEALVPEKMEWEVVVVDNRCTDETPAVVDDFADELPVRRAEEPRPGLSHARNRAVASARGEYIVWTDDDVRVNRGWLAAYADAFERWPDAAFFGGPVRPLFVGETPAWLEQGYDEIHEPFPTRDLGREPFEIATPERLPIGANFAAPARAYGSPEFDPRLGRSGSDLVGGEETEFLTSLLRKGLTGRWVPEAEVHHVITPEKQRLSYLRRRFRDWGRWSEYRRTRDGRGVRTFLGRPRWAWRTAIGSEVKYRLLRAFGPPRRWLLHLRRASHAQGVLMGPPENAEERRDVRKPQW